MQENGWQINRAFLFVRVLPPVSQSFLEVHGEGCGEVDEMILALVDSPCSQGGARA
jgi:hypothetical protein